MDIIKKSENNMLVTETSHKISHIYDATYIKCPEFGKSTKTKERLLIVWSRKEGWMGDHS
jgi:glycine cleavage system H lipoate-binding protein